MSAPAPQQSETELEQAVAARTADLSELLGYLTACWDEEKRQLARKLHDSLGSSMTALTMHLGLLTQQLPADQALRERSAQMKQLLATIIETNRTMQLALWNDKLEFLGCKAAIAELARDYGLEHGLAVRTSLPDEDLDCSRPQGVALLRCVEEGLRNVATHARASRVELILDDDGDHITLHLCDDGVGPGPALDAPLSCHGLRLLRERARALGGTLRLSARPEGGSALAMMLPKAA
jgi:signal transduction histidine kinase